MSEPEHDRSQPHSDPFWFGTPINELYRDPARYDPGEELEAAVHVALLLGSPLLLTGEPGCE
jgi:MoxR-like ATPase